MHKIFDVVDEDEVKLVIRIETLVERAFPDLFPGEKPSDRSGRRLSFSGEEKTVITEAVVHNAPPRESPLRRREGEKKTAKPKASGKAQPQMGNLAFILIIFATIALIWAFLR